MFSAETGPGVTCRDPTSADQSQTQALRQLSWFVSVGLLPGGHSLHVSYLPLQSVSTGTLPTGHCGPAPPMHSSYGAFPHWPSKPWHATASQASSQLSPSVSLGAKPGSHWTGWQQLQVSTQPS